MLKTMPSGGAVESFRRLFEHSLEAALLFGPGDERLAANPAACAVFATDEAALCASPASDGHPLFADLSDPRVLDWLAERQATGFARGQVRLRRSGGEPFEAEVSVFPFLDVCDERTSVMSIRDVSALRLAERLARESEQRLGFALEAADIGDWDMDLRTNVARRSLRHDRCFGYAEAVPEWGYDTFLAHVHPDDRQRVDQCYQQAMRQDGDYDVEFRVTWPDGSVHWLWSKGRFYFDDNDKPYRVAGIQVDVTSRRQVQEQLQRSEQDLAITLQSIGEAVMATDTLGLVTRMNTAAERLTGWTAGEAVGRPLSEVFRVVDADTRAPVTDPVQAVVQTGEGVDRASNSLLLSREGGEHPISDTAAPIRDAGGQVVGVVLVFSDVTEACRARQALAATTEMLERTSRMAKVGGWEFDLGSSQLFWSPETCRIHEIDPPVTPALETALGFYAPEALSTIQGALQAAIEQGKPYDLELPLITAKGRRIWVRAQCSCVIEGGKVVRLRGAFHDINERKLAETALLDSEVRYRELFDGNPQPMWVFDVETLAFVAVNAAAVTQYGYSREEFLAMTIRDIRPPEDVPRLGRHLASLRGSQLDSGIWTHRRKDGHLIQVEVASRAMDFGHRPSRLVLATDVTASERAEAEKARLRTELERHRHHLEEVVESRTAELAAARRQAEEASRAKSAFLANMSHEIRTPLNTIVGLNYLFRREPISPAQAARLEKIDAAGQHLLSIVNDVLDLSKIEAGRVQIENTHFQLSAVLDAVQSLIAGAASEKGLVVRIESAALPAWLQGDPTRLRQALLNFASNAVKFTEKGSITLRAQLLSESGDDVMVRFCVEDTGIGITPEQLPRLFQAFEQADMSITRKFGGTGLGLVISQRLARLMGGECGVESEAGVGSTFWFTARLRLGDEPAPPLRASDAVDAERQLRQRHHGARILLVEDNEVNLEVALAMLRAVDLDVATAMDGREAVRLAAAGTYDLVLMDMQMPRMGGLEATRLIRTLAGWQSRPMVALTANAFDEDRQACAAAGMNDFVSKPMEVQRLYETVLRWLDAAAGSSGEAQGAAAPT